MATQSMFPAADSKESRALLAGSAIYVLVVLQACCYSQTPSEDSAIQRHFQRAAEALKANHDDEAIREFRAVLNLDPANGTAHADLGSLAYLHGDCRTAVNELQPALAGRPRLTKMQAILAICEKRTSDPSAESMLEAAFADTTEPQIGPELRTDVGIELADLYYTRGERDHASSVVQSLVNLSPEDPRVLYMAQRLFAEMAEDTLHKLIVIAPDSAIMQQVIAERLVNSGNLPDAIEYYRKALHINSSQPGVHYELAQALLQLSSSASSLVQVKEQLDMAIKIEGSSTKTESMLGRIALLEGDTVAAYGHYERAHTLSENDVEAQVGLAQVLMLMGRAEEALPYLRSAIQQDPISPTAHYYLARVYKALHRVDEQANELKVFQEIQKTRNQVEQIYLEMNMKRSMAVDDPSASVHP